MNTHVSPTRTAHLPNCPHNTDSNPAVWGEISTPGAWIKLGNGEPLVTDTGAVTGRPAERRCRDCERRSERA